MKSLVMQVRRTEDVDALYGHLITSYSQVDIGLHMILPSTINQVINTLNRFSVNNPDLTLQQSFDLIVDIAIDTPNDPILIL